jgi:MFS family permease
LNIKVNGQKARIMVLISGIASLMLTLGIARFAYTPMLPVMQEQTWLDDLFGGWLAASNYIGYISGALVASIVSNLKIKDMLYRLGLVLAVITTVGMGLTDNLYLWVALRFVAGLSSATGLLIGSGLLLHWLIRHNHHSELGIHFSGLGLGIVLVSIAVWLMNMIMPWDQQWITLGIIGVLLLIPAWFWLPSPDSSGKTQSGEIINDSPPGKQFLTVMWIAYMCAGFGYVVTATFIVDMVESIPTLLGSGELAFLFIGLAAAPACILWDLVARRIGVLNALLWTYVLNFLGILLPLLNDHLFSVLLGSLMFGVSFIGIVSLVLTMAGRFYPTRPAILMGKLTIAYGIAQITAPAISGYIAEYTGSYSGALYMAAGFMILGTLLVLSVKNTIHPALIAGSSLSRTVI